MYIPCEASSWTLLHQNRKLSSQISLQNQLFCLCRLPAMLMHLKRSQIWFYYTHKLHTFRNTWDLRRFLVGFVLHDLVFCVMFCSSLFVLLFFTFWPLCCLFFFALQILITPLVSSDFWPLCCLSFALQILITSLVSSNFSYHSLPNVRCVSKDWKAKWQILVAYKRRYLI